MKDIFSPTSSTPDENAISTEPIALPGSDAAKEEFPDLDFDIPLLDMPDKDNDLSPDFYNLLGGTSKSPEADIAAVPDITIPKSVDEEEFTPVLDFSSERPQEPAEVKPSFVMPEEDLLIPDMPAPVTDPSRITKKSLSYESTVKIKNARHAEKNEERINEPIKKNARPNYTPRQREFEGIASGTAHVSGGLPELKDNQMYVAITPKELRRLRSRKFRGLGVFFTLCMAVVAAFCIWKYASSFADPIIGRWKGDINSVALGIDVISAVDQDNISSTWEFSDSGSLYVNLLLNDTPVSLSGHYVKLSDPKGEQYLEMTLKNPMDNQDYTISMYYTVTGKILQFNDMDGVGAEIDLTKE